ncbi:hypothetical protein C8R32_101230 [Nitrosospira sp. Nsp5]|uniref:Secreted protein n=1 Tax=Nitrosospira multiformis TaxID=1231 RepID=A0ABY0TG11_9PROT|nr:MULTISPECIES: hypothetical protein [Nitrosospira]PTR10700.1 hypothetical protein C8R32_101230 [Nitrosospira sp. Nsp5]SDQ77366.1 hypothetical protein SAMN05216402_2230 [Nitrosospira multiformis]
MQTMHKTILVLMLTGFVVLTPTAYAKNEKHAQPALTSLQGKAVRYLINPFGEVDGVFLDNGTLVRMPPHMSGDVAELVKPGDPVALQGTLEGKSSFNAYSITNTASDQTLVRRKPAWNGKVMPKELRVAELKEISAHGNIERIITDKQGEPRIILLADGTNVRLPKDTAKDAFSLINTGAPFAAKGSGTETRYGRSLEASTIGTSPASLKPLSVLRASH